MQHRIACFPALSACPTAPPSAAQRAPEHTCSPAPPILKRTTKQLHVDKFFLVQWVAPLASQAPEFVVCIFVWRMAAAAALGALVSSQNVLCNGMTG